jgi:hypothetical protein
MDATWGSFRRPYPPAHLLGEDLEGAFLPAPELADWALDVFVNPSSPLYHEEHDHLQDALIGCLWTTAKNKRRGIPVAGTAQIPKPHPALSGWEKELYLWQLRQWFGTDTPNFLITLSAPYAAECDDINFLALMKHELCHCEQARDEYGGRRYRKKDNSPIFTIIGHSVEEHISVVRDFGPVGRNVKEFVEAASRPPRIAQADIDWACGTCLARAA